jgi:hypothetical protein
MQLTKFVKTSSIIALSFIVLSFAGCSKGGDSGSTPTPPTPNPPPVVIVPDAAIAFDVKIDGAVVNYTGNFPVVGTSVTIDAAVTSTLPSAGVKIVVDVFPKAPNSAAVFTREIPLSNQASNSITITGLKPGVHCYAVVKINAISNTGNSAKREFDLTAK